MHKKTKIKALVAGVAATGVLAVGLVNGAPPSTGGTSAGVILTASGAYDTIATSPPCGLDGDAPPHSPKAADNRLKNRYSMPGDANYDRTVNLQKMIASVAEELDTDKAAQIDGYIVEIKDGGKESCNCETDVQNFKDTHIYIGPAANSPKNKCVIVEVTPRLRQIMASTEDWSTPALNAKYTGKHVRISGWLFYDAEHENASENIKSRPHNWRATCWEVHPVTGIQILP